MTVAEKLSELMVQHGLWPDEAKAVLELLKSENRTEGRENYSSDELSAVLDKDWGGYPKPFHTVAWMVAKRVALAYIDANKPQHFARPMFE